MSRFFGTAFADNPDKRYYEELNADGGDGSGAGEGEGEGAGEGEGTGQVGTWQEDWRGDILGPLATDANEEQTEAHNKEKAILDRFASPNDIYKSQRELQKKLSSGDRVTKLSENPTDEEINNYRLDNGIPDVPAGYFDQLGDLAVGENDKERADSFVEKMHGMNASPDMVKAAIEWSYEQQEQERADLDAIDVGTRDETTAILQAEWGGEFERNINHINSLLVGAPADVAEKIQGARFEDGTPLANDADTLRWLLRTATDVNPIGAAIGATTHTSIDTVQSRIGEIKTMMRSDRKAYNANQSIQAEYRKLLDAEAGMKQQQNRG